MKHQYILARVDATTLTRVRLVELHLIESIVDLTSIAHQKIRTDTSEFKYYEIDSKGRTDESY